MRIPITTWIQDEVTRSVREFTLEEIAQRVHSFRPEASVEAIMDVGKDVLSALVWEGLVAKTSEDAGTYRLVGRRSRRFPLNKALNLYVKGHNGELLDLGQAWGVDISYRGIGLITRMKLLRLQTLYVGLEPITKREGYAKITVTHCSDEINGMHRTGGSFEFEEGENPFNDFMFDDWSNRGVQLISRCPEAVAA